MVSKAERGLVGEQPRADHREEWEVFVRAEADGALRHVGSVTAGNPMDAHRTASRLFAWFASDVWVCPAMEVYRFSTHDLDDDWEDATPASGSEERTVEF